MRDAPPLVLTFAGTDPTGGAGLQADVLTLASLGCHPLSVVTAVTVQDSLGVEDFLPLEAEWVADQARRVLEDMPVAAFKIGMLGSPEVALAVAEVVSDYPDLPLVLDPVLASGRGDELATEDLVAVIRQTLLPQTTVLTPNSLEARQLAVDETTDEEVPDLDTCALRLLELGCEYVLVTGAHEQTAQVVNTLYGEDGVLQRLTWERLPASYHGSGCTLASALAALLAQGLDLREASRQAQEYTHRSLRAAFRAGMGQAIPDRLYWLHEAGEDAT
ncbi:MAG: bifunctional hydroxymethylpyrimidine kinase/phosphomethylpyrimidine kinase [Thiobacillaceae bacterium]|nr:bifunctional hydroxymethylpyrimidine kinase/phosphomethylpyrimidine kinase [Thiobacillaceae bacterium]MCX7673407.1 bifunctional hydroxymethylpyrimidine kinase/phosphomethylpyrimidine kinase [Thiobacillaceae bacterium]MDW8324088.1 bifunctional hydroxymethylpyrimidine kinase/phosphomethylpyrimidine kinase [Burkholderiales bacterium]